MDMEFISGRMEENMLVTTNLIKKVDLENITGTMAEYLKEFGKMVKGMDKAGFYTQMVP